MANLVGAGKVYIARGWYVLNNVWNPGPLVEGADYTINSSYDPANLTGATTFNWSFPETSATIYGGVRAYPEVFFGPTPNAGGQDPTDTAHVFPIQVSDIAKLTADYSVNYGGEVGGFDVAFDMFLTSVPNGGRPAKTNEVMVWLHQGDVAAFGSPVGSYSDANFSGTIYHYAKTNYTAIISDTDKTSGQIDIAGMLQKLQALGIVSSTEYFADIELGAEVVTGAGSLTVNNLTFDVQTKGHNGPAVAETVTGSGVTNISVSSQTSLGNVAATPVFALSPNDYSVTANASGSYRVQGPGGIDAVINTGTVTFSATSQSLSMAQFISQSFNPLVYLASNADLLAAFGDNQQSALQHFLLHGYYEGRDPGSFSALEYLASNPDLLKAFGDDQTRALEHYILHGYAEGRGPGSFSALEYLASNPDLLKAFGDDQTRALEHYILHGYYEGRGPGSFSALEYLASNPDLLKAFGDDRTRALEHYILHGYAEGRGPGAFDALEYIASSPDLAKAFGADVTHGLEHYILHGYYEGRDTASFDAVAYLLSNPDLQNGGFDAQAAELHYVDHGVNEGRSPSGAFGTEQTQHALTLGVSVADTIATMGDEDWFSANLTAGQAYDISLSGADSASGALADPLLEIHNATGMLAAQDNDSGPGRDALIHFTPSTSGTYYFVADSNLTNGIGTYKILAAPA